MRILDYNHCLFPKCRCGWNILLSGTDEKELKKLRVTLKKEFDIEKDSTDYEGKVGTEVF